jgi:murein DD-endopeptidase MepM/ murein hydrolase activator NlpD
MQRRIAGLAAALVMPAFPSGADSHVGAEGVQVRPPSASASVLRGLPARVRTEPLNAVSRAEPPSPAPESAFPVRGRHDFGTAVNGFGGGRGHDGQDIFARCGTPVVAARAGKVVEAETRGAEGNYVVMETADGHQQAYLHLLRSGSVRRGERVGAGERIGSVGQTGNADGCHLHFELWTAPGRFTGGRATDPRPALERWAR